MTPKVSSLIRLRNFTYICWHCKTSLCRTYRPIILAIPQVSSSRLFHNYSYNPAKPLPLGGTAVGPPPEPPVPQSSYIPSLRRRDAGGPKTRTERFWQDVHLKLIDGRFQILLDTRPIRTPAKHIISVPVQKPLLARALQIEWALMRSSAEALKSHLIPLTSLTARAIDLEEAEKSGGLEGLESSDEKLKGTRKEIVEFLMAYLDTDTVLMISPTRGGHLAGKGEKQLRDRQLEVAQDMIEWVKDNIPAPEGEERIGVHISDGDHGLLPVQQSDRTKKAFETIISELSAWDLVGLERAVIIGKSLLAGLRLVLENRKGGSIKWDVEDAAKACNLETDFQIEQWGLVEDTHDVNHADLRRGLGSVVLLVSEVELFKDNQ